jgi:uncharacterized protein (DUF302 family)
MKNKLIAILAFFNILAMSSAVNAEKVEIMPEQFMAMVQITIVDKDITGKEVDESIKSLATTENILHVAMFPLSEQIGNVTGTDYRHLSIHNICDAKTAGVIADVDDRFTVILPCKIAVVEGKDGIIRMFSMNPDVMAVLNLPPGAKEMAEEVAAKIERILAGAKVGDI